MNPSPVLAAAVAVAAAIVVAAIAVGRVIVNLTHQRDRYRDRAIALAGEVNRLNRPPIDSFDVPIPRNVRPVLGEDSLTVGVDFTLPSHTHSCSLKSKVESSYSCEETANGERHGCSSI